MGRKSIMLIAVLVVIMGLTSLSVVATGLDLEVRVRKDTPVRIGKEDILNGLRRVNGVAVIEIEASDSWELSAETRLIDSPRNVTIDPNNFQLRAGTSGWRSDDTVLLEGSEGTREFDLDIKFNLRGNGDLPAGDYEFGVSFRLREAEE